MVAGDDLSRITRFVTVGYLSALGLIAALTFGIYLMLNQAVGELRHAGRVVNVASEQRMLSQRIFWLVLELRDFPEQTGLLEKAIARMESGHLALLYGDLAGGLPPQVVEELRQLYFDPPFELDTRVRVYIDHARAAVALGYHKTLREDMRAMALGDLLDALDAAVLAYEQKSAANVERLQVALMLSLIAIVIVLVLEAVLIFRPLVRYVRDHAERLYQLATRDALTGLLNRRHFMELGERLMAERRRNPAESALLLFDLDHFKRVNDVHGHPTGDAVLARTADIMMRVGREQDLQGRIGGEEFAILMPNTGLEGGRTMAERLRRAIEKASVSSQIETPIRWTASGGLVVLGERESFDRALSRADALLYIAKATGRNRIVTEDGQRAAEAGRPASLAAGRN